MATSEPVVVSWKKEGLLLEGATAYGRLDMASGLDEPGQGPTPMELLTVALAGCTSMDVVSILQKMRQPLEDLRVEVRGERADEHPKRFVSVEVVYYLKGAGREEGAARHRAVGEEVLLGGGHAVTRRQHLLAVRPRGLIRPTDLALRRLPSLSGGLALLARCLQVNLRTVLSLEGDHPEGGAWTAISATVTSSPGRSAMAR
jgi:putative redox protein